MPMLSKDKTLEAIKKAGISLNGNETWKEIVSIYAKISKDGDAVPSETNAPQNETSAPQKEVYVWLKAKAYIDDASKVVLNAGVYRFLESELPTRLTAVPSSDIRIFRDGVISREIADMARWCGLNPDVTRDDKVLLEKCLSNVQKGTKKYRK